MTRLLHCLLIAAASVLTGCPVCDPIVELVDDFDRTCAGGPCGWTAESGTITNVPTFHASEQGMQLARATRARRGFSPSAGPSWTPSALEITARCDPGTILRVSIIGSDSAPGGDAGIAPTEARRSVDVDVAATELFQVYENSFSWPFGVPVDDVRVETAGDGSCTIDDIVLTSTPGC